MFSSHQNTFRCVACPVSDGHLPFFLTFREVCQHSLLVHRVTLETAVHSSTVLPERLVMYQCRLCPPPDQEIYLCETLVKAHLETHSAFFFKRWKEFTEVKCRVCEMVIESDGVVEHLDKLHPRDLFADIKDLEENDVNGGAKITSQIEQSSPSSFDGGMSSRTHYQDSSPRVQASSDPDPEEKNKLSMVNEKSPLDMLLEMGLVETLVEASEQTDDSDLIDNNTEPNEAFFGDNGDNEKDNNSELVEKIVSHPRKVKFMSGYAYFFQHEKSELKKRNPKDKLNIKMTIEKWKNFSRDEKKVYKDIATKYKSSGFNPVPVPKEKVKKLKPKVKTSKPHIAKVEILNNREFVDKFEDISSRNEKVSDKNKLLLELISEKKLSILKNSHELQKRKDSEAEYKARFQKLSVVHEKCLKGE